MYPHIEISHPGVTRICHRRALAAVASSRRRARTSTAGGMGVRGCEAATSGPRTRGEQGRCEPTLGREHWPNRCTAPWEQAPPNPAGASPTTENGDGARPPAATERPAQRPAARIGRAPVSRAVQAHARRQGQRAGGYSAQFGEGGGGGERDYWREVHRDRWALAAGTCRRWPRRRWRLDHKTPVTAWSI